MYLNRPIFIISFSIIFLLLEGTIFAETKLKEDVLAPIQCSIQAKTYKILPAKPATVSVIIKNLSDQDIDLLGGPTFTLTPSGLGFMQGYWSPVDIMNGLTSKTNRLGETTIHWEPSESKEFTFDLTQLLWEKNIGTVWPSRDLFMAAPKGKYILQFKMKLPEIGKISSNQEEVIIEGEV